MVTVFNCFSDVEKLALEKGTGRAIKHIYANIARQHHMIRSTDLLRVYDSDYATMVDEEAAIAVYQGFSINSNIYFAYRFLERLENKSTLSVLDFGCGAGTLALPLALMGYNVTGIDFSKPAVDKANNKAISLGLQEKIRFTTAPLFAITQVFDYIVMSDVVEHLSDAELKEIFAKCRQITRPGGAIIIHTPNGRSSKYKYCRERLRIFDLYYELKHLRRLWLSDKKEYLKDAFYDQTHINVMGPRHLQKLLNDAGFVSTDISFDDDVPAGLKRLRLGTLCAVGR